MFGTEVMVVIMNLLHSVLAAGAGQSPKYCYMLITEVMVVIMNLLNSVLQCWDGTEPQTLLHV